LPPLRSNARASQTDRPAWNQIPAAAKNEVQMNWIALTEPTQLESLAERSKVKPQVIFKHSTRCNISSTAKYRLENGPGSEAVDFYYLDLLAYRAISNQIAERFQVPHASPQVLVIREGRCVYDESHLGIYMDDILEQAAA
jgi:bacillithiol system protein YtxJ